jgi:hypothetical protein
MKGEPFAFARSFIIAYCGVTDEQARRVMEALEGAGIITRDRNSPRDRPHAPILWRIAQEQP